MRFKLPLLFCGERHFLPLTAVLNGVFCPRAEVKYFSGKNLSFVKKIFNFAFEMWLKNLLC